VASGDVESDLVQAFRRNRRHELDRMFGPGGGWGIPIAPPSLMITIGGIDTKPRYFDSRLQPREMVDVTVSVDHDLIDGATASRFARWLAEFIEAADGLLSNK
jgi:pyruvate/2-oxoglutarate dehydrogenase complex dihydrolipoamide acyltransferase (E2) component